MENLIHYNTKKPFSRLIRPFFFYLLRVDFLNSNDPGKLFSILTHWQTHSHTWKFAKEQLQGVLYVPFDRQSGSSHLRALDCESAPSEWITEAFSFAQSQIPGDTAHRHHQAPSEHLPKKNQRFFSRKGTLKFNIFSKVNTNNNGHLSLLIIFLAVHHEL